MNLLKKLFGKKEESHESEEPVESTTENSSERELERFEKNDKYGFKDKQTGKVVVPAKYDDAHDFSEGLAAVKLDGKWGFIDKTGKKIIPLKYDDAEHFSEGLAPVKLDDKWGFIDKTGKEVTSFKYDDAKSFSEDFTG
jgi:hypothetical protein